MKTLYHGEMVDPRDLVAFVRYSDRSGFSWVEAFKSGEIIPCGGQAVTRDDWERSRAALATYSQTSNPS